MNYVSVDIPKNGRFVMPAKVRRSLGLENGGTLTFSIDENEVRILSRERVLEEVRAELGPYLKNTSVDDFIAERRMEAAREEEKDAEQARLYPSPSTQNVS